jgi:hypothetical protein
MFGLVRRRRGSGRGEEDSDARVPLHSLPSACGEYRARFTRGKDMMENGKLWFSGGNYTDSLMSFSAQQSNDPAANKVRGSGDILIYPAIWNIEGRPPRPLSSKIARSTTRTRTRRATAVTRSRRC